MILEILFLGIVYDFANYFYHPVVLQYHSSLL